MTVTPVGLNQNVYAGQQVVAQPVQQNAPVAQPIPVGQPIQAPQVGQAQANIGYPVVYPNGTIGNFPQSTGTYDKDVMMNNIDFVDAAKKAGLYPVADATQGQQPQVPQQQPTQGQQPAQVAQQQIQGPQPQQQQVQVVQQPVQPTVNTQQNVAFTGNPFQSQQDNNDLTNYLVTDNAKAGAEKKFKLGPTIGTAVGFAAPFVCNKARLGKVLTKDLLVKVPVMTTGGLCAGGITEGLVASAKKLEAENAESEVSAPAKMDAKA